MISNDLSPLFFLLLATLFHSHDSYKNGNVESERIVRGVTTS